MGLKSTGGGEIIHVQGGHIIRATGRKDRHSKVFTAKGARDRRVRLAAHTAIQFYDVQDRLGYDRPSKAVDWLINKAKAEIDKLAKLPPWDPTTNIDNSVGSSKQIMSLGSAGAGDGNLLDPRYVESSSCDINSFSLGFPHQDLCGSDHDPGIFHGFEGGCGWAYPHDIGRFSSVMGWGGANSSSGGDGKGGILFNYPPTLSTMANYCRNTNERSTLQSSSRYFPSGRVFEDNNQSISGIRHGSNDSLMGYYIPTQIQGDISMPNNFKAF